jgi:F-type H+-transporting ATPase subunit gamma
MASVQDIKRRIRSVRNTRKITRAMELVAAAKLRRAEARIEAMRPYADTMRELIGGVGRAAGSVRTLPLLQQRDTVETVLLVPLTGDRGLAGAFNAQVLRRSFALERQHRDEGTNVRWLVAGKKGRSTLSFRRRTVDGAYTGFTDRPAYADAQVIAHRVAELFVEGEVDRVVLVYNTFVSALTQRVTEQDVLPISAELL